MYYSEKKMVVKVVKEQIAKGNIFLDGVNYLVGGKPLTSYKTKHFCNRKGRKAVVAMLRDPEVISVNSFDKISNPKWYEKYDGAIFVVENEEVIRKYNLDGALYIMVLNFRANYPIIIIHDQWDAGSFNH